MGEVLAFPGVTPPEPPPEPEPDLPFEDWRDREVGDLISRLDSLMEAENRDTFDALAADLRRRIEAWADG